ncbi:hypothetical protein [Terribacillus saccharophilus]|uniref:hypothetical protein n=1 Tax=Terribacillus saccharophilus TaxID=361277 RepID=UPI000C9A511C|nr:hypothetical protein [Terribacillus goriensis]
MAKKEELKDTLKEETTGKETGTEETAAATVPDETKQDQETSKPKKRKFVAVQDFKDLQDNGKVYLKGDSFPKPVNKNVSDERLQELLTAVNNQNRSVIKEVE